MKQIPLSQGQVALVDDADYEWLNRQKWHASWNKKTKSFYAASYMRLANGVSSSVSMHRAILGLNKGDPRQGHHKNHQTLDNQRENLEIVTHRRNQEEKRVQKNNKLGLQHISIEPRTGHFRVSIKRNGVRIRRTCRTLKEAKRTRTRILRGDLWLGQPLDIRLLTDK